MRGDNLDQPEQVISVSMKRKFVDLASMMVRTKLYVESKTTFLPDAMFTKEIFASDYFTFTTLMKYTTSKGLQLIHNCLLFHQ